MARQTSRLSSKRETTLEGSCRQFPLSDCLTRFAARHIGSVTILNITITGTLCVRARSAAWLWNTSAHIPRLYVVVLCIHVRARRTICTPGNGIAHVLANFAHRHARLYTIRVMKYDKSMERAPTLPIQRCLYVLLRSLAGVRAETKCLADLPCYVPPCVESVSLR